MGSLTLGNFRDELRYMLENRGDISVTRYDRYINRIYEHVCYPNIHKHWELEATIQVPLVLNQFAYSLANTETYVPDDQEILGVRSARYVNSTSDDYTSRRQHLKARSIGFFNRQQWTTNGAGPNYYGLFRKQLIVAPGPDSSISGNVVVLEVWLQPKILTASTDTTVLIPWWDEVILTGAKWLAESELGYLDYAEQSRQLYINLLNSAPNREFTGKDDEETMMMDIHEGEPLQHMG